MNATELVHVICGRLPAGNLLILHETRATAGNRVGRVILKCTVG